jgi:uncharacterized metal-binding protein
MINETDKSKLRIVVPCSGIGKVHGLIAREATYLVTDELATDSAQTLCLALLVSGDEEALAKVRQTNCITVDGCPKMCAQKNVELAGGTVVRAMRVVDAFKNHRGAEPGTATTLADDGWKIAHDIAADICSGICCSESETK